VTVARTEPGEALKIEVQGRLAALLEAPVFPSGSLSRVKVVAGARYRLYAHQPNLRYLIQCSA
jgi:hypothetical protein